MLLVLPLAAIGALIRWQMAERFNERLPLGTLAVNLVAAFAVGLLSGLDGDTDLAVRVGLLGALSTWSTLAHEVASLARNGKSVAASGYLVSSVALGVGLAWAGLRLAS